METIKDVMYCNRCELEGTKVVLIGSKKYEMVCLNCGSYRLKEGALDGDSVDA